MDNKLNDLFQANHFPYHTVVLDMASKNNKKLTIATVITTVKLPIIIRNYVLHNKHLLHTINTVLNLAHPPPIKTFLCGLLFHLKSNKD